MAAGNNWLEKYTNKWFGWLSDLSSGKARATGDDAAAAANAVDSGKRMGQWDAIFASFFKFISNISTAFDRFQAGKSWKEIAYAFTEDAANTADDLDAHRKKVKPDTDPNIPIVGEVTGIAKGIEKGDYSSAAVSGGRLAAGGLSAYFGAKVGAATGTGIAALTGPFAPAAAMITVPAGTAVGGIGGYVLGSEGLSAVYNYFAGGYDEPPQDQTINPSPTSAPSQSP